MPKPTLVFIIALTIIAGLLGYNYIATPFYHTQETETQHGDNSSLDLESLIDSRKRTLNQLSAEQKIAQIMSFPHKVGSLVEYSAQTTQTTPVIQTTQTTQTTQATQATPEVVSGLVQDSTLSDPTLSDSTSAPDSLSSPNLTPSPDSTPSASAHLNPFLQLQDFQPGIITFFGSKISWDLAVQEIKEIKQLFIDRPIQPLLAIDHEGGSVQRFSGDGFTVLPPWRQLCQETQMSRQEKLLESAHELLELGINIVFAPVVDLNSSVLSNRSCADERNLISASRNYIEIFGSRNIMSVIKHYPGLGSSTRDLHKLPDEITLNNQELEIFNNLLSHYPTIGLMTSHAQVVDRFNGLPCSLSQDCIDEIAKKNITTVIFSDALEMGALQNFYAEERADDEAILESTQSAVVSENFLETSKELDDLSRVSYLALMAGNHVLVYGEGVEYEQLKEVKLQLAKLYEQDEVFAQKVDQAVLKVLGLKKIE